jgi:phage baseplate assembly protein gpV
MIGVLKGALGIIHSINTKNYTARVKLLEYENKITEELAILSPLTYQNKEVHIPKINTPVFCIFTDEGAKHGFIIGAFFSDNNKSESVDGEYVIDFNNSKVIIKEDGNVMINANLTSIDSEVEISENVTIKKNLKVKGKSEIGGTVEAEGIMYAKDFIRK